MGAWSFIYIFIHGIDGEVSYTACVDCNVTFVAKNDQL